MTKKFVKRPALYPKSFLARVSLKDKPLLVKSQSRKLADKFERIWKDLGGEPWTPEYKFHPTRKFLLDYAWPDIKVGLEINGGSWSKISGHNSGKGLNRDAEKGNLAQAEGWTYIVFTTDMVTLAWCTWLKELIERKSK